ncbi:hypothetical protein ACH4U7_05235 [Streptomyces sp. NPDC020845]|uniref:hypothetical protein n=1 Tax=Streptomyces sp. NPDC020845 TaxID=3365096 RepID=UPI00379F1309
MTFPPSPNDSNRSGNGGGFGPPPEQGFGPPPEQSQGQGFGPPPEQGFGPPAQPGLPAPQGQLPPSGGFGPPAGALPPGAPAAGPLPSGPLPSGSLPPGALPPGAFAPGPLPSPPPRPGSGGGRTAAIAIAAVVAGALVIGGILIGTRDDGDKSEASGKETAPASADAKSSDSPSASASPSDSASPSEGASGSADPGQGAPLGGGSDASDGGTSPSASEPGDPGDLVPYAVLKPGECFDHPALDSSVTKIEKRACSGPHDGEVVANETLTGDFSTEKAIQDKALSLCETDAKKRLKSIPNDGRMYYYYALYPALATYRIRGEDQVSCALTLSSGPGGKKLTKPLPG